MKRRYKTNSPDAFLLKNLPQRKENSSNHSTTFSECQSQPKQDCINSFDSDLTAVTSVPTSQVAQVHNANAGEVDQNNFMVVAPYDVSKIVTLRKQGKH